MAITDMATTAARVTDIMAEATGIGPAMPHTATSEAVTMVTPMAASTAMRAVDSTVAAITVVVGFTEVAARTEAVATAK
jgi:hypothetical protein